MILRFIGEGRKALPEQFSNGCHAVAQQTVKMVMPCFIPASLILPLFCPLEQWPFFLL
jgi:hypothetical protein